MKKMKTIIATVVMLVGFTTVAQNEADRELMQDAQEAKESLLESDQTLQQFFEDSAGYVLFPNVGEGGFILGGASGNGIVYEDGEAIGTADLKKIDIGFQIGGQAVIEVIFFKTEEDLTEFKEDQVEFSAEISAIALKSGVSETAKYKDGVAVFVLQKSGLMADVSAGGQRFRYTAF